MDDEELIRTLAARMLALQGYDCALASEGCQAVEAYGQALAQGRPFQAVILDLNVRQGMGGLEALKALKALDPGVKAILFSGEGLPDGPAAELGFAAAINKPFDRADLLRTVAQALSQA
jgi:DNA-binding NtrC family response regulator